MTDRKIEHRAQSAGEALDPAAPASRDWLPTPANINALPDPVRRYIMHLETDCDPAGTIRSEVILREHTVPELQALVAAQASALAGAATLIAKVPLPPNAITYEHGVELLDELQKLAVASQHGNG